MQAYDASRGLRDYLPLQGDLYVEEITDLDPAQQQELYDAIIAADRDSKHRFIVSTRYSPDELKTDRRVDSRMARMWQDAIRIPSLSEHIEDIPELLEYYVNWYSDQEQLPYRHFDVAAQNLLRNHRWSGDITQLKQFIKTILSNGDSEAIGLDEIEQTLRLMTLAAEVEDGNRMQISIDLGLDLRDAREAFEREYLSRHLALCGHNMTELARRVGQERTHLYRKLKALGLQTKKQ